MDIKKLSKFIYLEDTVLTDRLMIPIHEVEDGQKVLEIGVGQGETTKNIGNYKRIDLYAVDVAEEALMRLDHYVKDSQIVDISKENLKFQDNFFDSVICLEVFEHLENPYHALSEIQRVLKPRGKLILSIPNHLGGHLMIYPGLITFKFFSRFLRINYFKIKRYILWGPVLNKDNIGKLLKDKIPNSIISNLLLRFIQVSIRILQGMMKLFRFKAASLYWCYIFICENRKDLMDKALWIKQSIVISLNYIL